MPTTRRQFIKQSAGVVSLSLVMPRLFLTDASAQTTTRKIFVVVQLSGGNDGLNTVVPYSNSRYHALRPMLGFRDTELQSDTGQSTIIDDRFGLHPELAEIKELYDQRKVAIVLGVSYPSPNLSHFTAMDIWQSADPSLGRRDGWLGRYADVAFAGRSGISAVSIGSSLPKALASKDIIIPSIANFQSYDYLTDNRHTADRNNQLAAFRANHGRAFPADPLLQAVTGIGRDAVDGAQRLRTAVGSYSSPVRYPQGNQLANALLMAAQVITTVNESVLLHVQMGGFDNHANQVGIANGQPSKLAGDHARLLRFFSEAIKAFYDDMAAHGLADNVVIMQWSEFGRRVNENNSLGTDHGSSGPMFIIGNPVQGGIYGAQPSLEASDLDRAGNMKFSVDFRAVYSTVLAGWLDADSRAILGGEFENLGFLG